MTSKRRDPQRGGNLAGLVAITLAAVVGTAAGVFHVWTAQGALALRRAIWVELTNSRDLLDQQTELRREQARMTAVPRTAVKAEVMGLRPPRPGQVIEVEETEEVVP